ITPAGETYRANDARLLTWVQATAGWGFAEAYHRYARPLGRSELDRFYAEGAPAARLYGALDAPGSEDELQALFASMHDRLEPSPIVLEFLAIMRNAPIFSVALRPAQRLLIRAAIQMVPGWIRERLGLAPSAGLRPWQQPLVRGMGVLADRVMLRSSPAVQSCLRLGLPADHLYRR
ncbi:MAG: oxygenase MpaB family protein, partial [Alphaproteobacteria bacterium]|nr:oxygenase MpaB family protein [Alphaproteobacteria bacterium]